MPDVPNSPEPYSEADTRQQLIDRQLLLAGWDVRDPLKVMQELDIVVAEGKLGAVQDRDRQYQGHQFADYGLMLRGRPAAVVEAKKTSRDAQVGQEQARQYAIGLDRIYPGSSPFVMYSNGHKTFFWDTDLYPPSRVFGFPSPLDLEWMQERRKNRGPLSVEMINPRIAGRDYQIEAIRTVLEEMEAKRRKFLMVMATGTGKTRTAAALVDVLMRARWVKRVLFLVDRIALRDQALEAFKEHLPSEPRWPEQDETKFVRDRRIYVTTYPTMLNLIEGGTTPERWISPFFFDLIVADESHRSIYNIYKQVIEYFHGLTLGLTATPRNQVAHDTFQLFDCPTGEPTFVYTYEEAVAHRPPYLCEFEVLKLQTRFQVEGIRGPKLDEHEQEQLEIQGFDPERVDWEGTDLEKKVANSGTNAQIVREFMEESIKDPTGTLPGKSIIFACSVAHARRLQEIFDRLYPEHRGRLAKVLVSDDSRVHGKGGLLDQFKNLDMPRVAISVDMLDTGVDILEVVNLVFAKPVYSLVKFWQMIGRGTRVLKEDPAQRKPWCPEKDRFLIMDCWANFDYFDMHPKGREPGSQVPLPVRLFRARLDLLTAALAFRSPTADGVVRSLRADLSALPAQNVVVMEAQAQLARVRADAFWARPDDDAIAYLRDRVAPILRAQSGLEVKAVRFEIDVTDFGAALLRDNAEAMAALRDTIVEQVAGLPMGVNLVAKERTLIDAVLGGSFWTDVTQAKLDELVARLGPLMHFRREDTGPIVEISLADITAVHERIASGTGGADLAVAEYRKKVEEAIRQLLAENDVLQRLQAGETVSDDDLRALAELLRRQDPGIDEERLRKAYDVRSAPFKELIRQALGVGDPLERWPTMVTRAFEEFIAAHTTYSAQQIRFLQTLRTFVLQRRRLERQDLVEAPFTQVDPKGIRGIFPPREIEEVIGFATKLVA